MIKYIVIEPINGEPFLYEATSAREAATKYMEEFGLLQHNLELHVYRLAECNVFVNAPTTTFELTLINPFGVMSQ